MPYDKLVSISAMVTALVAVVIAVVELQTTREYQRLSVEPYIEVANTYRTTYERILVNSGLGPARIVAVKVEIDGSEVASWNEAIAAVSESEDTSNTYSGLWRGRQIQAGEEIVLVNVKELNTARAFYANIDRMSMHICYCSIYSECWIKENYQPPKLVDVCPANWSESFPL